VHYIAPKLLIFWGKMLHMEISINQKSLRIYDILDEKKQVFID
jgi:hypothetical protein